VVYVGGLLGGLDGFGVTLLHVIHAPEDDFFTSPEERERWIISGRDKVSGWLAGYRELLIAAGFAPACVGVRTAERDGPSLAHLILDEVAALGARTVVMGRQGLSRREAFLFGSVSRQVVDHARNLTVWVVQ
jgi:nucleotide-binding universal stress UspA family protein